MYTGRLQVTLYVRDVPESVDFYQRVLGFAFRGYWSAGEQRFVQSWSEAEADTRAELFAGDNRVVLRPSGSRTETLGAEYVLEVDDLDVVFRRIRASGGQVDEPRLDSSGARAFRLVDSDGHVWTLYQAACV